MKVGFVLFALAAFSGHAYAAEANPIQKILEMISGLQAKLIKEGESTQKIYEEFSEWCEDTSRQLHFEIKTGKSEKGELEAKIADETSKSEALENKIGELAADISENEKALQEATEIRTKEALDFGAEDKDLTETVDMLQRAIGVLEREMQGGSASLVQMKNAQSVAQALSILVQASAVSSADATKLTALVQSSTQSGDSDEEPGAPDAAVYENKSGGIVDTLSNLLDKAESQLAAARKEETQAKNNYEMQKQALDDAVRFGNKDMDEAKKSLAASGETKAAAGGDLEVTNKDLAEDMKSLSELHHDCMSKASAFEEETKSRGEELAAIAKAKQIIVEATGGAEKQSYSFLQASSRESAPGPHALHVVRRLAFAQKSPALAQLASRMESAIRFGAANGADVFAKIKGLISDMIARLEDEASADATEKSYCDKEMGETTAKKEDKEAVSEKLSTKIDQKSSEAAKLEGEVATIQKELGELIQSQATMDELRGKEKGVFDENKPEIEQGLNGIKMALKVLKDYYAQNDTSGSGAASGIIGLLEVAESDFSKNLAEMVAEEEAAAAEYDTVSKENAVAKTTKEADAKYKTQEIAGLKKAIADLETDHQGVSDELDAVLEYYKQIQKRCVGKAEPYEERKKRREAELAGLQDALQILGDEAAFLQKGSSHRTLRGSVRSHAA